MVTFEEAKKSNFGRSSSRGGSRNRSRSGDRDRGSSDRRSRDSGRGRSNYGDRRQSGPEMTRVTCDSCGDKCEVPFRPTSSKPVYCRDCFDKGDEGSSQKFSSGKSNNNKISESDLDIINAKLNKIMKALKIE